MLSIDRVQPNFPPCSDGRFDLAWTPLEHAPLEPRTGAPVFAPLRARSGSGRLLRAGALVCRDASGASAGGCAVALPEKDDVPSPRHVPHPVLGEWISALRYTGCAWIEAGPATVRPGFSEEQVMDALWTGLKRLMQRNGVHFLVGAAPVGSLALDVALRQGARALEPLGPARYFLYAG